MRQAIVIVGGFNSVWTSYLGMARTLEDLSGLPAVGVPLMPWHWWLAGQREDATNVLQQVEGTVIWARRRLGAERFVLVGHSAGGVVSRLYLSDLPAWGRVYAGQEHVDALITLGSPHCPDQGTGLHWFLTDQANHLAPGAACPQVRYVTVAGRYLQGREDGSPWERRAFRLYRAFGSQGDGWGDGMVPLRCAALDGVDTLILDGVAHSRKIGRNWYGNSRRTIQRWWPAEVVHAG